MLPSVHARAQHALFRCRRYRRLTAHEVADYGALLDLASRPHRHHAQWARMCGYDPDQVGTVVATNRVALSEQLGLGRNSETLSRRLARYEELGLADERQGLIVLRPNGVVRIDDHRAAYETDAALADGQPWPVVDLPRRRGAAELDETPVPDLVVPGEIVPRSADRGTIPLPYKGEDAGERERARAPDPLDELATLLEDAALPLADGVPFRLSPSARRRLGCIVDEHGVEAVRAVLVDVAPKYCIRHPMAWLETTLSKPAASPEPGRELDGQPPTRVVSAVRACIAPDRYGDVRELSQAELSNLAGLVERHGAEAVIEQATADDGVAGYALPVQGIAARIGAIARRPVDRAGRKGQARSDGRPARPSRRCHRRDTWAELGRRVPLTPEQEQAQRDVDEWWTDFAAARRAAEEAAEARRAAEEAAERAAAEREASELARRAEARQPELRRKLEQLALVGTTLRQPRPAQPATGTSSPLFERLRRRSAGGAS